MKRLFLIIIDIFFPPGCPSAGIYLARKVMPLIMLPQWELSGGSCEQAFRELQKASVRLQSLKPDNLIFPVLLRLSEWEGKKKELLLCLYCSCGAGLYGQLCFRWTPPCQGCSSTPNPPAPKLQAGTCCSPMTGMLKCCTLLSHLHFSLERKYRCKLQFRLLKLGQDFPWQVCLLLPCSIHGSLCSSPCPSLSLTLHQPLLSHQMWFRDIWTWSENALKCRKDRFELGSGNSFPGDANTSTAKHFLNQTSY